MRNSLHETTGKYENLNSMKSHLRYYHTKYCNCTCLVNCVYMNSSQQQIHTYKSHNIKQIWNTKSLQYHITTAPYYYHKTLCSCKLIKYSQLNELLQIAKFDLADGLYPTVSNSCKCFYFTKICTKLFSFAQIELQLLDHIEMLLNIICPNVENFCPNNGQFFSVGDATASPSRIRLCCVLKQGSKTRSSMRQSNLQLQNQAALMSRRIRAIEHRMCAAGLAGAHPGLQNRILLNYRRIEHAHKVRKKTFDFFLCIEVQQTFTFPFSLLRHYQMPECFYIENCCFWGRATVLPCCRNW